MIANLTATGWEIIYHRAHALLAAQLGGQWKRSKSPVRLYETIAAISHHDDLEKEWEEHILNEAGAPLDFTLSTETSVPKMRGLTENSLYRGRWVAMLISMHMSYLNEGKRGESKELDDFLDEQLANQKKWREEMKISKEEAESAYAFFQWCDRLSLILCSGELPAGERALEISVGPDGKRYDILQHSNELVTVTPWPFEDEKFTVNVEACHLDQVKFDSNQEIKEALHNAPKKQLEWTFVKS
jgi:hypothetical protein